MERGTSSPAPKATPATVFSRLASSLIRSLWMRFTGDRRRRRCLATPTPAAPPARPDARGANGATASPDARLIAACAEHAVNRDAFNRDDGTLDPGDGPLWAAYDRTRTAISEAEPQTLEGVLAKARIAKAEALNPDGSESIEGSVAAQWSWDVVNDLLRLNGRA